MGLLSQGTPLPWSEARQYADHVRRHGIDQFLKIYSKVKDRKRDCLYWGDEVEYMLLHFDDEQKRVRLSLRAADVLKELELMEKEGRAQETSWKPEYARYMLEATPASPYGASLQSLLAVESNMAKRRLVASSLLKENEALLTITCFPRLGCPEFLEPSHEPRGKASHSMFIPDEAISPHARFPTLTQNIRERRGCKVAINIPVFHDEKTPRPFLEQFAPAPFPEDGPQAALPDHVYMDAMCFGMGCSCLQITFQACNIREARYIYDQLAVISPLMLALTASSPIMRGYLVDVDCRWDVISASVDDRNAEELGLKPLEKSRYRIYKSRYGSVSSYLSLEPLLKDEYNDLNLVLDEEIRSKLVNNSVDPLLARHVAHLFIRDPLVIYKELLDQNDESSSDHFENIQSTNWQSMRFKPPPPNSNIGWRVEFRTMEVQWTDFENAAFAVFIVLLRRAILSFGLNFYIPISKVDENMKESQKRNAVGDGQFFFRSMVYDRNQPNETTAPVPSSLNLCGSPSTDYTLANEYPFPTGEPLNTDAYEKMSLDEIFNGRQPSRAHPEKRPFPGLIPLVEAYLNTITVDLETRLHLERYLQLIRGRASGKLWTPARWMRSFVTSHPAYKKDSRVNDEINYDLMRQIKKISNGEFWPETLFGKIPPLPPPVPRPDDGSCSECSKN